MKKGFSFIVVFLTFMRFAQANILLVDNNPNSPQKFTSIQVAIDSAIAGDTVMVEGSPIDYGEIFITKPLTLFGEGYHDDLGENAMVDIIHVDASNVYVAGFYSTWSVYFEANDAQGDSLSNVTIERCYFTIACLFAGGPSNSPFLMHNIKIRNTVTNWAISVSQNNNADWITFDTIVLENNICTQTCFENWGSNITGANTIFIRNNDFIYGNGNAGGNSNTLFWYTFEGNSLHDAILSNNIFYDCNPSRSNNCIFFNNLTYGNGSSDTLPGPQNNNIYSQDPLFVNYTGGPFDFSQDFNLSDGSLCIGTGVGGTNIGTTGGYFPFIVGEGPKIPEVTFVNISNSAVPGDSTFYLQFDAHVRK